VRSCDDVHDELAAKNIPHEILHLPSSSKTAQLAAEALGVDVGDVVKSLLFMLDERPVLALVTGDATVDGTLRARPGPRRCDWRAAVRCGAHRLTPGRSRPAPWPPRSQ
jgi:prolyl-tRNA editing enzyme YbaK/EbsC (Cys-tRNA(Pro) deacylase)